MIQKDVKKNGSKGLLGSISVLDQPYLTLPEIDKISLVVRLDKDLHGQFVHEALCYLENKEFGYVPVKSGPMYTVSFQLLCPDAGWLILAKNPCVLVQATTKDHPNRHIRIEYNPTKLFSPLSTLKPEDGEPVIEHLDLEFTGLCGYSFFELISAATVSRLDVCVTVMNRHLEDYLYKVKYNPSANNHFGKDGHLESIYYGKRSGNQIAIYDKAKELYGKKTDVKRFRMEVRLKPTKMPIQALWGLENPFGKISLHSLYAPNPPLSVGHWIAFQDACRYRGMDYALKMQPPKEQKVLKKFLNDNPVSWWGLSEDEWTKQWHWALEEACLCEATPQPKKLSYMDAVGAAA